MEIYTEVMWTEENYDDPILSFLRYFPRYDVYFRSKSFCGHNSEKRPKRVGTTRGRHRGGFTEPLTAGQKSGFTAPITADKNAVFQYRGFSNPPLFQKCLPQKPHFFKTHTVTVTAYRKIGGKWRFCGKPQEPQYRKINSSF